MVTFVKVAEWQLNMLLHDIHGHYKGILRF